MDCWQPGMKLEDVERAAIIKAFHFFQGNKTRTAAALNIAIRTLDAKLAVYFPKQEKIEEVRHERRTGPGSKEANEAVRATVATRSNPNSGIRLESVAPLSEEQSLSLSKREEVQEMLPSEASKGNSKRRNIQKGVA